MVYLNYMPGFPGVKLALQSRWAPIRQDPDADR